MYPPVTPHAATNNQGTPAESAAPDVEYDSAQRFTTEDLAYVAVFAAILIVLAFVAIPLGVTGVPIVLQNAVVIMAGLILGGKRGFLAVALFLLLGLLGLPVLAGARSTLSALAGPSVGYLVGYLVSAFVAGSVAYRAPRQKNTMLAVFLMASAVGLCLQYLCGAVGLVLRAELSLQAAGAAQLPFLIADCLKAVIASLIAVSVHTAFPDVRKKNR